MLPATIFYDSTYTPFELTWSIFYPTTFRISAWPAGKSIGRFQHAVSLADRWQTNHRRSSDDRATAGGTWQDDQKRHARLRLCGHNVDKILSAAVSARNQVFMLEIQRGIKRREQKFWHKLNHIIVYLDFSAESQL